MKLQRAIDLRGAISINVITMIGIGPLVTIPLVIAALAGPLALVGWIAGAIVALSDGLVWAELSSRYPGSGGTYVYLRNVFGPQGPGKALAFLFNWQFLLAAPCVLASGYIGFANYAAYLYPPLSSNFWLHDAVAVGIGLVTLLLLYRRTADVAWLGALLAVVATLTIAIVALAGLSHANFAQVFHFDRPLRLSAGFVAGFGAALYITLYDYGGYYDAALVGEEVARPSRTIPMAIVLSVLIVAVLYVLLQIGVLGAVPWQSLLDAHGQPTVTAQYVGAYVVEHAWGRLAAIAVTLLVLVTAFASLYGNLLGSSRIPFAAARDGAFLPIFGRLHPRKEFPHLALLAIGILSLVASLFTLDQVIAFCTAGIVLIQGIAQIVALGVIRSRSDDALFRMPLYPVPALVALAGWIWAFAATGITAITLGVGWLVCGSLVYVVVARFQRWWPFALAALAAICVVAPARAERAAGLTLSSPSVTLSPPSVTLSLSKGHTGSANWLNWKSSGIISEHGYPIFTVDGRPFFVYGAAFFYERIPRDQWLPALLAYKALGINTIDLYVIWNWHAPSQGVLDFTGTTNPQRDLMHLLHLTHDLGFKIILRPGPVIRNEWRNGGYPGWLLERAEYRMPLHDVLEGRYPATATLQNAHADAAAQEWLSNATHLAFAASWLRDVLHAVEPYSHDVIAIALDDDQGAYLDNDTWPAPHWHAYIAWLRSIVASVVGSRVPLFVNTYEMKVTAASPVWAWGNWYQGGSYTIGEHDLGDLDFATGLLQTQPRAPVMQSEFQAGWFQDAEEGAARPSDPSNSALALNELLRDGAHGIVNFPVQDTIYPHGWEVPWANWSYAWDAALTVELHASARYAPTRAFGDAVGTYGAFLARTHVVADASIVWPPSLFRPGTLSNDDFSAFADGVVALQRECNARGLTCTLVDLAATDLHSLRSIALLLPRVPSAALAQRTKVAAVTKLRALHARAYIVSRVSSVPATRYAKPPNVTVLLADDASFGFLSAINPTRHTRRVPATEVRLATRTVRVASFEVAARGARLVPIGITAAAPSSEPTASPASPPPFHDADGTSIRNAHLRVVFAPFAGARIAELDDGRTSNAATSIGLLRDATDPQPLPSARDFIASYTHPLPAGTFNRPYECASLDTLTTVRFACSYDAPDVPDGGALFKRTFTLGPSSKDLVVNEEFSPHDPRSRARLESISGFAFAGQDLLLHSADGGALAILHGKRLTILRWRRADVVREIERRTRGAELVTLILGNRSVELRLGLYSATNVAEAQRLLDANQP